MSYPVSRTDLLTAFGKAAMLMVMVMLTTGGAPLAQRLTRPQPLPQCQVGQWPQFNYGFAALRLDIGDQMGEPVECEHAIDISGNTAQRTTTGLASYDNSMNTPTFTRGNDHWALNNRGLVYWTGPFGWNIPSDVVVIAPPDATRLAQIAQQNSRANAHVWPSVFGSGRADGDNPMSSSTATAHNELVIPFSQTQIGPLVRFLGVNDPRVQQMTTQDVFDTFARSRSTGDAARAIESSSST
jgi:hypothetical protein